MTAWIAAGKAARLRWATLAETASSGAWDAALFARHKDYSGRAPNGVIAELKKVYYDVTNSVNPSAMSALTNLVPQSQMLFGSDYP